jgi:hypothetical protein
MALSLDHPFLMHTEHRVDGLQLRNILGFGARSTVYNVSAVEAKVEGTDESEEKSGDEGEDTFHTDSSRLPDRAYCKIYATPPDGELGLGAGWQGCMREKQALLRLKGLPNIPSLSRETKTLPPYQQSKSHKHERVLVLSPVGLPLWPTPDQKVVTGQHFAQLVSTVEAMHSAGVLHRDIKPANVFLQEDSNQLLLADFDAAVLLEEVEPPLPPPPHMQQTGSTRSTRSVKVKAPVPEDSLSLGALTLGTPTLNPIPKVYRRDQEFAWVGTVGYSDSRPAAGLMHTPTPEHDLVALVRTVYSLYTSKSPPGQFYDKDARDNDGYWADRMPAASMWQEFLQMARNKDYETLRLALGKL